MNPKFSGFLADFQKSLTTVIKEVEIMPHHFKTEFTKFNTGFLDGNLIKKFLELSISNKKSVIEGLKVTIIFFVVHLLMYSSQISKEYF